jgi:dTDP-4-dehydrorhamnose reductase
LRVTVLGSSGLLGKYLLREWKDDEVTGLTSADGDIRDLQQVQRIFDRCRPEWIILAAAYTDVDGCEAHPDLAFQTNCTGAINVAKIARELGVRLLFLSSDYVFDGTKSVPYETGDPVNPKSVYGRSKAAAETGILQVAPDCCIVRTSWVFGTGGKCFPDTIIRLAKNRNYIDVVDDQRGSPTYAQDLAQAIIQLCRNHAQEIVHVTNAGDCSWFEFASEIIRLSGLPTTVRPTTTAKFPRPAERPKYSVLSKRSVEKFGIVMPTWQAALHRYLGEHTINIVTS